MNLRNFFRTFFFRWFPVIVSMGIIFLASSDQNPYRLLPTESLIPNLTGEDTEEILGYLGHFLEYFLLGLTVLRAVVWQQKLSLRLILISAALCMVYAVSDEFHQLFVPGRTFQLQDLLIDALGISGGTYLQYLRIRRD